jgi:RecA-family ATPase
MTSETDYDFNDHFKDYGKLPPLDAIEEIIDRPRVVESGSTAKQLRYRLIPFRELKPATVSPYLIKGLIPRTGLVVVWGPPKCGKSFWTFDLSMHVALGWEYRGRRTSTGPVVYCAFEGGDGFKGRVEAFRREHSVTEAEFYLVPSVMNLIADHQQLIASIRGQTANPSAVVLDTLNRSLVGSESK